MKIHEIEYFFWVCKYKSFSKAAQNLFISRQSLLRSVNNLENEMGYPLFSRGPIGVTLTEFGEIFYEHACKIMDNINSLQNVAEEYNNKQNAHISIGIRGNFRSAFFVKRIIKNFQKEYPQYDVELIGCETSDIIPAVQESRLDFGFTVIPDHSEYSNIACTPLERLDFSFLTSKNNHLSKEKVMTLPMLDKEKIMLAAFSTHPAELFAKQLDQTDIKPDFCMDTIDLGFMIQVAHEEIASGILLKRDAQLATEIYDNLVAMDFEPNIYIEMGLISKKVKTVPEHKKVFLNYLKKNYTKIKKEALLE